MKKMPVIVTRTQPGADALAARLSALGYAPVVMPCLDVEATHAPMPEGDFDGTIITSAHALLFTSAQIKDKPLYAVGPSTADTARALGCENVTAGGGDVKSLAAILPKGRWLHVCGADLAPGTDEALPGTARWIVYRAVPQPFDKKTFESVLATGEEAAVLVHSARAAAILAENVQPYAESGTLDKLSVFTLSHAVLECVAPIRGWSTYSADAPDENTLIDLLVRVCPPN